MKNNIKLICDRRNLSPYQMAKDIGISQKTAYDLYNRPTQIPFGKVLEKICRQYRLTPNDVIDVEIDFGIPIDTPRSKDTGILQRTKTIAH